jgi:hypothetical protein
MSSDGNGRPEPIYLPEPTPVPFFVAAGVALVLVGLFVTPVISIFGAVLGLAALRGWLRANGRDIARLRK